jgi:hypothetical protein
MLPIYIYNTHRHDITEIWLKVALNIINHYLFLEVIEYAMTTVRGLLVVVDVTNHVIRLRMYIMGHQRKLQTKKELVIQIYKNQFLVEESVVFFCGFYALYLFYMWIVVLYI